MTTIENTTQLVSAVIAAGVGGIVTAREGYEYLVGQDDSGDWTLTSQHEGGTYENEPLASFDANLNWSVVNSEALGELTETQTRAEFFRTLNPGTVLRMKTGRTRYIYFGFARNDDGDRVFRLVTERWVDTVDYSTEESELENDWEAVEVNNNGLISREIVDTNTIRHIELLLNTRRDNRSYSKSLDELGEKHEKVLADFTIVNDKLCEFAVDRGYCPDFEEVIGRWNRELKELELLGRPRQFSVALRIQGMEDSPCFMIYPTARSEKQAREAVSRLGTRAILEQMIANGSYFDGLVFEAVTSEDEGYDN